eukprot:1184149-Amphidinium_carterae.2
MTNAHEFTLPELCRVMECSCLCASCALQCPGEKGHVNSSSLEGKRQTTAFHNPAQGVALAGFHPP